VRALSPLSLARAALLPAWLAVTGATAAVSLAHGLDTRRAQIVVQGRTLEIVFTPPVAEVAFADVDGDGLLTVAEVSAHRPRVRETLAGLLDVTDDHGRRGGVDLYDVSTPEPAPGLAGADHLRVTLRLSWPEAPSSLRVRSSVRDAGGIGVTLIAAQSGPQPGQLVLMGREQAALLTPSHPEAIFSLGPAPARSGPPSGPPAPAPSSRLEVLGALLLVGAAIGASAIAAHLRRGRRVSPPR
jgi:hypothetical protein